MPTAKINYTGSLHTDCTHCQSGNTIATDAPTDNFGKGEAFSPTDLLATSLASCMLTTMAIAAQKSNFVFGEASSEVTKIMADSPRRVAAVQIIINMPKQEFTSEQIEILEQAAHNCPVAKSLHSDLVIELKFNY